MPTLWTTLMVLVVGAGGFLTAAGCQDNDRLETIELKVGEDIYTVEVAGTPEQRQKGLMHRDSLGEYEGMLFVFERDQHLSFWMKNTTVPLSIAYIAREGTIKSIFDMRPLSEQSVESGYAVRYALELPQGAFERSGSKVGDTIEIPDRFQ
ncbi:MAG: DUF192 domain-containing protein [Sediminispirochaetaceae bacterium]